MNCFLMESRILGDNERLSRFKNVQAGMSASSVLSTRHLATYSCSWLTFSLRIVLFCLYCEVHEAFWSYSASESREPAGTYETFSTLEDLWLYSECNLAQTCSFPFHDFFVCIHTFGFFYRPIFWSMLCIFLLLCLSCYFFYTSWPFWFLLLVSFK